MSENKDNDHFVNQFKQWVKCKGLFHVASRLGHNQTSIIERWEREDRVPMRDQLRIMRLMKEEGLWEDMKS